MVEFSHTDTIKFNVQVDSNDNKDRNLYDIILGTDFMSALGIQLNVDTKLIQWNELTIPMKEGTMLSNFSCEAIYFAHTQSPILQELEER